MIKSEGEQNWSRGPQQGNLLSLRLHSVGYLPTKSYPMHWRADMWAVGIVWRGSGWYRAGLNEDSIKVEAPFYFYVWPGEEFEYEPDGHWEESYFCFSGERCAEWEDCGWLRRVNSVYPLGTPLQHIRDVHMRLLALVESQERANLDRGKCLTEELLCLLNANQVPASVLSTHVFKIESLARQWRKEPWHPVNMEAAAASKGMSYAHFRRKFREIIGQSPYQYLAGQRIGHACRLLTMTSLSIKEIAASSGFDYTESFNRLFRQYMNQSPKSYRNSQYARAPKSSEE